MRVHGWWWKDVSDFEDLELFCVVCGRDFEQFDVFYTARRPTDEQVAAVEHLFGVDIFCDFDVCRHCVADTPFDEWLEARQPRVIERAIHDWKRDGF